MRKRDKRQKKRVGYESHSAPSSFPSLPFSESVSGVSFRSLFPESLSGVPYESMSPNSFAASRQGQSFGVVPGKSRWPTIFAFGKS